MNLTLLFLKHFILALTAIEREIKLETEKDKLREQRGKRIAYRHSKHPDAQEAAK